MTFLVGRDTYDAHVETFTGNASTTAFTLANSTTTNACVVRINGVVQRNGTDFTVSGTTITFTTAPPNASNNVVVQYFGVGTLQVPTDASVTAVKLGTNAVTNAKVADDAIGVAELSATGTPSNSNFLRGDNSWAEVSSFTFTEVAAQATTSGTSVDFTIPSGAKRFTVLLNGVSNSGNSAAMGVQLGDSGGIETSGYGSIGMTRNSYEHDTGMFQISRADQTDHNLNFYGLLFFETLVGSSDLTWIGSGVHGSSSTVATGSVAGYKSISAELTTVRFKTDGTFDAGSVSLRWASA